MKLLHLFGFGKFSICLQTNLILYQGNQFWSLDVTKFHFLYLKQIFCRFPPSKNCQDATLFVYTASLALASNAAALLTRGEGNKAAALEATHAFEEWPDAALQNPWRHVTRVAFFTYSSSFVTKFWKPFKNSQHVAEPSVGQKIVPGDMLRGDRLSAIRCCAENRCCKLTRVTPPLDDRQQCWQLLRSSACTTQQVPTSTSNSQHCWANKVVTCCVRLNGP